MIIQGTNIPLTITFDADLADIADIVVTMWRRKGVELKRWTKADMSIEGDTAILPITEEESASWPEGYNTLSVKGLDENGQTVFWEEAPILVEGRNDKSVRITGG